MDDFLKLRDAFLHMKDALQDYVNAMQIIHDPQRTAAINLADKKAREILERWSI
jgi:hypothetical protein